MKSHLLVRVRLVCLLSEGVGVVVFPDMAALPVIAGLDHEDFPRGETDPSHHPALPLTQEPLGPLVVIVQEHGHSIRDETSHQGNIIILGNGYLGTLNHLSIYRKADLVETPILTSPSQWRDESRRLTQTQHTELEGDNISFANILFYFARIDLRHVNSAVNSKSPRHYKY